MKTYFMYFDFYNRWINKFYFGVVTVDLSEVQLIDLAKQIITDNFKDIDPESVTIKVSTFNNIDC